MTHTVHSTSRPAIWRHESTDTIRLATPLIIAFAGNQLLGVVDTLIAGQMGTLALAAVGVGNAIFRRNSLLNGLISALETIASQAIGGKPDKAYVGYRATMVFCFISLIPVYLLLFGSEALVRRALAMRYKMRHKSTC